MKGHQGLDALAALCGGVKAHSERASSTTATSDNKSDMPMAQASSAGSINSSPQSNVSVTAKNRTEMNSGPGKHGNILNTQHPVASAFENFANAAGTPNRNANRTQSDNTQQQQQQQQQQQWYQAMVTAACGGMNQGGMNQGGMNQGGMNQLFSVPGYQQSSMPPPVDTSGAAATFNAVQQLAFYHYYQAQANAAVQAAQLARQAGETKTTAPSPAPMGPVVDPNIAAALALANGQVPQQLRQLPNAGIINQDPASNVSNPTPKLPQHIQRSPVPPTPNVNDKSMQPPPAVTPSSIDSRIAANIPSSAALAPQPTPPGLISDVLPRTSSQEGLEDNTSVCADDKKQLKRAANRRSAQLSRKRKKQYIEELKDENDELKRKEQILRSIPDLIVVFDSSGKLCFISHSVDRFLHFSPQELEGTSFWERLCDESVRLLKAAFMDALAAKKPGVDTAPLGNGLWELRLVDRNSKHKLVTLNGVVHFSGETPECVCSIRPCEDNVQHVRAPPTKPVTASVHFQRFRNIIKPQQSVISSGSSDDASVMIVKDKAASASSRRANSRLPFQISDGESVLSETGSDGS